MTGDPPPGDERGEERERWEAFGPIDAGALRDTRDLFVEMEPLVSTAALDDTMNPTCLSVEFSDGIGEATAARIDVRWSLHGNYVFHYSDDAGVNFRFDCHPKPYAPERHFHPPPDAPSRPVEPSCITVSSVGLVTRAVLKQWRYAYDRGVFDGINDAENPP